MIGIYPKKYFLKFIPNRLPGRNYFTLGGRGALFQFLNYNPSKKKILVPSYNCGQEIEAIISSGHDISVYKINKDMRIDLKYLRKLCQKEEYDYILITHFFGMVDPNIYKVVDILNRYGIEIIEDACHCLINSNDIGNYGVAVIYSMRKFLPNSLLGVLRINKKEYKIKNKTFFRIFGKRESFNKDFSPLVVNGYSSPGKLKDIFELYFSDLDKIRDIRRSNASSLMKVMKNSEYKILPQLAFPILKDNLDNRYLENNKLELVNFWSKFHSAVNWDDFPDAVYLKNNIFAIPLNQDILLK